MEKYVLQSLVLVLFISCTNQKPQPVLSKDQTISKIAIGSCAQQWLPQPIWEQIGQQKPDAFLFIGDAIYGDWDGTDVFEISEATLDRDYARLQSIPEFADFRSKIPILATWDNHDYGKHNGGAEFKHKELSKRKFLDFFKEPQNSERRYTPGIYDATIYGPPGKRAQIILLDTRWFKGPFLLDTLDTKARKKIGKVGKYIGNPNASLLGEQQWKWLEQELRKPAEIRCIVSSTQIIPDQKGMDEWGNYPNDRNRLFNYIANSSGTSILLSGNVHFGEISTLTYHNKPIYELTSSGLTHINETYGNAENKYRVGKPLIDLNFGCVQIDWQKKNIALQLMNSEGLAFEHILNF